MAPSETVAPQQSDRATSRSFLRTATGADMVYSSMAATAMCEGGAILRWVTNFSVPSPPWIRRRAAQTSAPPLRRRRRNPGAGAWAPPRPPTGPAERHGGLSCTLETHGDHRLSHGSGEPLVRHSDSPAWLLCWCWRQRGSEAGCAVAIGPDRCRLSFSPTAIPAVGRA